MTRYVIDAPAAIQLARDGVAIADGDQLVAPTILRSQCLSSLYQASRRGELSGKEAMALLDRITSMHIRLLGDRVSRAVAWQVAERLHLDDTANAEYIAVAQLQADAFVTLDPALARQAEGIVAVAPLAALYPAT
ncbi:MULTISPECIES: type II toxin-antitoxin system VapC family toxin [unclassified Arthrobacter]|uniref:type II toxin-antitoxin system VapC family toxin n=1 Tax=unclassified Arthrobacter TaxID=235627 RepID=UPI00159DC336|nr:MULTISPECIES: type II toxin-antitoxin system VapC family toxin [unclassified Arthrobacter]MCQ9166135.1 type II toxin-antitoxin system VapC family toxin [Arthrobacter sp. STN4]NVM97993.1 type II toxin-antitoxin system VapC family toxin [Arthrobacter sp. SDTb3-6]